MMCAGHEHGVLISQDFFENPDTEDNSTATRS